MLNNKQRKDFIPFILFYIIACVIFRIALKKISPIFIVVLLSIPLIFISFSFLKYKGIGDNKTLNVLFVITLDVSFILLFLNIITMEIYPVYLKSHEKFFDSSIIVFIILFILSGIIGLLSRINFKK